MRAGKLTDRLRFDKRTSATDGYGNTVSTWAEQFTRQAEIRLLKGGDGVIASRLMGVQPAVLIVRYDPETVTITPEWRAVDVNSGVIYALRSVADMERARRWLTIVAEAGVTP